MMQLINSIHDVAAESDEDDLSSPMADEEERENYERSRGGKQVRFSSGLPPTRQSRFGRQDEDEIPRSVSPDQQVARERVCV